MHTHTAAVARALFTSKSNQSQTNVDLEVLISRARMMKGHGRHNLEGDPSWWHIFRLWLHVRARYRSAYGVRDAARPSFQAVSYCYSATIRGLRTTVYSLRVLLFVI
jgi:hypothetical protein